MTSLSTSPTNCGTWCGTTAGEGEPPCAGPCGRRLTGCALPAMAGRRTWLAEASRQRISVFRAAPDSGEKSSSRLGWLCACAAALPKEGARSNTTSSYSLAVLRSFGPRASSSSHRHRIAYPPRRLLRRSQPPGPYRSYTRRKLRCKGRLAPAYRAVLQLSPAPQRLPPTAVPCALLLRRVCYSILTSTVCALRPSNASPHHRSATFRCLPCQFP
jgi:hypothetical protein